MTDVVEAARKRLARIVRRLRKLQDGGSAGRFASLSQADAEYLARAFEAFLNEGTEMDRALGVRRGRGKPSTIPVGENEKIALDVIMRTEWAQAPETMAGLSADWGLSERRLAQIRDEHRTGAMRIVLEERLSNRR